MSSFTSSQLDQFTTAAYLGLVHNCTLFEISDPNLGMNYRDRDSHASLSYSKKPRQSVPKSSSCDGQGMAGAPSEKLCASSGISLPLRRHERSRNIRLNCRMSPLLNWSLCLTSVEQRLALRSKVCACLDFRHQG